MAQWRVLMAHVDSYRERAQGEREGSPIPVVELFDTSGAQVGILFCFSFLLYHILSSYFLCRCMCIKQARKILLIFWIFLGYFAYNFFESNQKVLLPMVQGY